MVHIKCNLADKLEKLNAKFIQCEQFLNHTSFVTSQNATCRSSSTSTIPTKATNRISSASAKNLDKKFLSPYKNYHSHPESEEEEEDMDPYYLGFCTDENSMQSNDETPMKDDSSKENDLNQHPNTTHSHIEDQCAIVGDSNQKCRVLFPLTTTTDRNESPSTIEISTTPSFRKLINQKRY